MKKSILITGGCGFIGSNFIRHFLNKHNDERIINLDKITYAGNPENLRDIESNPNYAFVKGDIATELIAQDLMKDCKAVIHFAAESHVDRSIDGPYEFSKTNYLGTHILLEAARKQGIEKFLFVSTDEVYGSVPEEDSRETDKLDPSSAYSASKAAADLLVLAYNKTYNLPVLITRSSNNFGPYQYPEKLMPLFITNILEGKKVPLYGNGKNIRDWIYVIDNCEAIDFVFYNGNIGEIYNIGSGDKKENIEITKAILKHLEKDGSHIEYVNDRLGHDARYSMNCSKIKKLGWWPRFDFDRALEMTIEWYKNNEVWWKPLKK